MQTSPTINTGTGVVTNPMLASVETLAALELTDRFSPSGRLVSTAQIITDTIAGINRIRSTNPEIAAVLENLIVIDNRAKVALAAASGVPVTY